MFIAKGNANKRHKPIYRLPILYLHFRPFFFQNYFQSRWIFTESTQNLVRSIDLNCKNPEKLNKKSETITNHDHLFGAHGFIVLVAAHFVPILLSI